MIHKKIFLAFALLIFGTLLTAQPVNDDCENAIQLSDVTDWCSPFGQYTNVGATASGFTQANCFSNNNSDVWFSFTAVASDVTVTIVGAVPVVPGGTLNNPSVALYSGDCEDTISELNCESDEINNNIIEVYRGGLTAGVTYYIRVNGRANNTGTFQLCINNYYPPVQPGSDCGTAAFLCDTSPFTIQSVVGAGSNPNEAAGTCLDGGLGNSESNSTWFTWTAANNDTLTFTLTPTNPEDDLDFILYELPNGICGNREVLRCMASGDEFPGGNTDCLGPTGLAFGSTDTEEAINCENGSDNFLAPLEMDINTTYGLLVNNFTATGNGFSISFGRGGSSESSLNNPQFVGPNATFTDDVSGTVCAGESITFTDGSSFNNGSITSYEWNFGLGAIPQTATGQGPHTVQFTQPGSIAVVLRLETNLGCIVSHVVDYPIDACCDSVNEMIASFTQTNLECAEDADGSIDVSVSGGTPPFEFEWSSGETSEDLNGLDPGNYVVTISDQIGCETIFDIDIDGPPAFQYTNEVITMPTCGGGTDGAINFDLSGATPPYTFAWTQDGAPFGGDTPNLTSIPVDDYAVTITDANGCQITQEYQVRELQLQLGPDANIVSPSCNGESDGTIELSIANGQGPYEFDLGDGNFTDNNIIENVAAGTYTVTIRDANMCMGDTMITVTEPDLLVVALDSTDISCFGEVDGMIDAFATGGTPAYTYTWQPAQANTPELDGLNAGDYSLTVTDENGCVATATTTVIEPAPINIDDIIADDNECFGGTDGQLTVDASGGNPPFMYSANGGVFQTDSILTGLPAGTITVTVQDASGCETSAEADISQPAELIFDAGDDVEIDLSYSTDLNAILANSTIDSILWSPSVGLSRPDIVNPTAMPPVTTTYVATAITPEGCEISDSVTVTVNDVRPVYIPNIFSPNFDGANDTFTAFGGQAATLIKEFRVYDRWGGLMYESTDIDPNNLSAGWDGTAPNGREVAQGVYVYHIRMEFFDGAIFDYQGDVMVVW